jgi:5-methylcytosine-specific restriction endonuclease McrA
VDAANITSVISEDNKKALLAEIAGKTQKQIEEIVAMYGRPRVVSETVRVIKVAKPAEPPRAPADRATLKDASGHRTGEWQETYRHNDGKNACSTADEKPDKEYEKKFHYSFTVSEELNAKIQKCKALLSGKYPTGVDQETLLEALTEMFLDRKDPERRSKCRGERKRQNKPKQTVQEECSRYIGPATRDAVYSRDGGQCTYVGSNGKRCESKWNLEIHHDETPFAMGGNHNISNLRLLCAPHNKLEAELLQKYDERGAAKRYERVYGRRHMKKYFKQQE